MQLLEISDPVVDHDPQSLDRLPFTREAVVARLASGGRSAPAPSRSSWASAR
ncbi:hypothetical protein [Streptomyces sp. NPDC050738]|uniref:hypothetical protein n=1 Tax=Streptomyces sp. NPDC050738 TaxID=3154744 RepID=UPI00342A8647